MGSQVDATIEMVQSMIEHYRGGKLKILASFTNKPLEGVDFPAIGAVEPALAPYLPYGPYFGLFAPAGTPDEVIKVLKAAMDQAIKDPRWTEYCKKLFLPQINYSGEAAIKFLNEWTSKAAWIFYDMGEAKNSPPISEYPDRNIGISEKGYLCFLPFQRASPKKGRAGAWVRKRKDHDFSEVLNGGCGS
jgi:hypothetical protein